jgi:hypothetical protein
LNFLDRFSKILKYQIFLKIHPVAAELFPSDGRTESRTDMKKLIVELSSGLLSIYTSPTAATSGLLSIYTAHTTAAHASTLQQAT